MSVLAILAILLLTLGATAVFYAHIAPHTVPAKTAIAAIGFLVIFIILFLIPVP